LDRNLFLAFALSFAVLTGWMLLTGPPERPATPSSQVAEQPAAAEQAAPPALAPTARQTPLPAQQPAPKLPEVVREVPAQTIRLERPLYFATLTTRGAGLEGWELRKYDTGPRAGRRPIRLVEDGGGSANALLTPLEELGLGSLAQSNFELESNDGSTIAFRHQSGGVVIRKVYSFEPDGYAFTLKLAVENGGSAAVSPRFGVDWPAHTLPGSDFKEQALAALHEGSVTRLPLAQFGTPGFFDRTPDLTVELPRELDWAGVDLPYFLGAVLPDQPALANARFQVVEPGRSGLIQVFFDPVQIPPSQSAERVYRVYLGPKEEPRLEALGGGLIRAIDLGYTWVVPLTRFFHWLLQALYTVVPNYGVAIIVLTILVRLVTAPLTNRQMRSMERMRALAPKLEELKAKHADDKAKQSEAMMKLYRQEGVNPLGGCLPMVLQIPVFIGLFYALRSSIELRHSPFFGWITDLSIPESLFTIPGLEIPVRVLPILMGASMIAQQKLTPMQMDPAQAKMMLIVMPVMMTVMFYQFPSGLVLYWMVSNVIAIAHQLWIGRRLRVTPAQAGKQAKAT
jgi:YidC/Oxa1 family membrane protein insertase